MLLEEQRRLNVFFVESALQLVNRLGLLERFICLNEVSESAVPLRVVLGFYCFELEDIGVQGAVLVQSVDDLGLLGIDGL